MKRVFTTLLLAILLATTPALATVIETYPVNLRDAEAKGMATLYHCAHDDTGGGWTGIGWVEGDAKLQFSIDLKEGGSYLLDFYSGANGCSSNIQVTVSNNGRTYASQNYKINDIQDWKVSDRHTLDINNLPAGRCTVTMKVLNHSGTYAGNFGNFKLVKKIGAPAQTRVQLASDRRSQGRNFSNNGRQNAQVNLSNCIIVPGNIDLRDAEAKGYAKLQNCDHDGTGGGWTGIGWVVESSVLTFTFGVQDNGNYRLIFYSGAYDCSSTIQVSVSQNGRQIASQNYSIRNTNDWKVTDQHQLDMQNLNAGKYTVTLRVLRMQGANAGNFGNFEIVKKDGAPAQTRVQQASDRRPQGHNFGNNGRQNTQVNLSNCIVVPGKINLHDAEAKGCAKLQNCNHDGMNDGWDGIGWVVESSVLTFTFGVQNNGNYRLIFYSGAYDCSSTIQVSVSQNGRQVASQNYSIRNTNDWKVTDLHQLDMQNLNAGKYTVTLRVLRMQGANAGNFGNFEIRRF